MAGYAIECTLKALILSTYPMKQHGEVIGNFRGAAAHRIEDLQRHYRTRSGRILHEMVKLLADVSVWTTDLRYDPGQGRAADARTFVATAQAVYDWGTRTLP